MEKTTPAPLSAKPQEQLALPLEESAPPSAEAKEVRPREAWTTLKPRSRASVRERWAAVMREAVCDARD
jgi:hypothetical protein